MLYFYNMTSLWDRVWAPTMICVRYKCFCVQLVLLIKLTPLLAYTFYLTEPSTSSTIQAVPDISGIDLGHQIK